MKSLSLVALVAILTVMVSACGPQAATYACTDRLGCISVAPGEAIKVGALLTLTTADAPYGIDALRGVEIAISDKAKLLGHSIDLVKADDLCSEQGGAAGANQLAADPKIVGVIGATCSGAALMASRILSGVGSVLISPSSTAPSLTSPDSHDAGFLRTIYNDKAQGQAVAQFAFNVLGSQRMITIQDGSPYSEQLQAAACDTFQQLGGQCVKQIQISPDQDVTPVLQEAALDRPDVLFYPIYATDGAAVTKAAAPAGLSATVLMSSDGLLSSDFIKQTAPASEGMYLSGPATTKESQDFLNKYQSRYGEAPIASYHLQGYDAAMMLFAAVEKVAVNSGGTYYIPRQALRDALYATHGMQGLSGTLTCSPTGDCAQPNIAIFQVVSNEFKDIYP
jgi:branched-chain amino acid transport system substrate-binding protein